MSETQRDSSCLNCGRLTKDGEGQQIFDEIGIELELNKLLAEHFKIVVKKAEDGADTEQVLCEECVNRLVELYDAAEYEKEKNVNKNEQVVEEQIAEAVKPRMQEEPEEVLSKATEVLIAILGDCVENVSAKLEKDEQKNEEVSQEYTYQHEDIEEEAETEVAIENLNEEGETTAYLTLEQGTDNATAFNEDIQSQLEADNAYQLEESSLQTNNADTPQDQSNSTVYIVENMGNLDAYYESKADTKTTAQLNESAKIQAITLEGQNEEILVEEIEAYDIDEIEIDATAEEVDEEYIPDADIQKANEFDFVDIDVYLEQVLKSKLEEVQFNLESRCELCSESFVTFQELLNHIALLHYEQSIGYICLMPNCSEVLKTYRQLARHIILRHCDLNSLLIYGCCVECDMRFSNFIKFNKHSCCRSLKLRPGTRFFCLKCNMEFPSWKRYVFHMQFHLTKRRPKVCFLCESFFNDSIEFFEHVHYAHDPLGHQACKKCDRIFKNPDVFKMHMKNHENQSKFLCQYCSRQYDHRHLLARHLETIHRTKELLSCDICERDFCTKMSLMKHKKSHIMAAEVQAYYCDVCGLIDSDRDAVEKHVSDEGGSCQMGEIVEDIVSDVYNCEYCNLDFRTATDLKTHRDHGDTHANGMYSCRVCKLEFTNSVKSRNHHKTHKSYVQWQKVCPFKRFAVCEHGNCMEAYSNWSALYAHRKRSHNGQTCEVCNRYFGKEHDYNVHKSKCQLEPEWTCQFCEKQCKTKMSLSVHIARVHNNNNVTCPTCNASYTDEAKLQEHISYWHIQIYCEYCNKMIKNQRNYDTHLRNVHLKEERYMCDHCEKGFFYKSERDAHVKNVHPSEEYTCNECTFTTTYPKSLEIHIANMHKMEYQYKCHICGREFGRKHVLEMHIKRHEIDEHVPCPHCKMSFLTQLLLEKHLKENHQGERGIKRPVKKIKTSMKPITRAKRRAMPARKIKQQNIDSETSESTETIHIDVIDMPDSTSSYIELTLLDDEDAAVNEQETELVAEADETETTIVIGTPAVNEDSNFEFEVEKLDADLQELMDCE